jgi:glycosyltransferase involved in cell wall biosynthesis
MKRIPVEKPIVFINQSSGYLMVDIINQFTEAGYHCILITGLLVERNIPLYKNVIVRKIIRYNNTSSFRRIFTWGWGTIQAFLIILLRYRRAHLFIVSNPPIAALLPLVLANPFSLLIFDVYPDAIAELGVLKKQSLIIRIWRKANRRAYSRAKDIFTITEGMKELLKSYVPERMIKVVPLWSDNKFITRILPEENPFIKSHDLGDRFVVLYSGNIGISNDVEVLIDVANLMKNSNITIIIIGGGARRKQLEEKVKNEGQDNIFILPSQDVRYLPYTLSAASLAVVALGKSASRLAMPSKIFSLLSLGVPIMGIAGEDSDLHHFIESHNIGRCFLPENTDEMAQYIIALANNPEYCKALTKNALLASKQFTRINAERFVHSGI